MTRDLTSQGAADVLGLSRGTIANLADAGELPHRRTKGCHRRFLEADLHTFKARRLTGEPPEAGTRASVWHAAAAEVLRAAEADLGSEGARGAAFRAAREELERGRRKAERD